MYDASKYITYSYVKDTSFTLTVNLPATFIYNKVIQFNIFIKDNVGSTATDFQWGTTTTSLTYAGNNVQLRGFSLTGTEYISSLYPYDTFYDFTNNCITTNFVSFINTMVQVTNNSNVIPAMRIPMCADYFLAGSAPQSSVGTGCNIYFTATQYQQMIIDLITAATSSGSTFTVSTTTNSNYSSGGSTEQLTVTGVPNAVIILDLHWNYSTQSPKQSYNGTSGVNYNSGQQLSLPGVFLSNGTESGTLSDNTLDFWTTVAEIFGVNSSGTSIFNASSYPSLNNTINYDVFSNIFFELYNEPVCDQLTTSSTGGYVNSFSYLQNYQAYINGGQYYQQGTDSYSSGYSTNNLFSFTGFGICFAQFVKLSVLITIVFLVVPTNTLSLMFPMLIVLPILRINLVNSIMPTVEATEAPRKLQPQVQFTTLIIVGQVSWMPLLVDPLLLLLEEAVTLVPKTLTIA